MLSNMHKLALATAAPNQTAFAHHQRDLLRWQESVMADRKDIQFFEHANTTAAYSGNAANIANPNYNSGHLSRAQMVDAGASGPAQHQQLTRSYSSCNGQRQLPFLDNFAVAETVCRSFQASSPTHPRFVYGSSSSMPVVSQDAKPFHNRAPPRSYASFPPTAAYFGNYAASSPNLPKARDIITASTIAADNLSSTSGNGNHYYRNDCRFHLVETPRQHQQDFQRCASFAGLPTTPVNHGQVQCGQVPNLNRSYSCVIKYTPTTNPIQLWKFLVELLLNEEHKNIIAWTGRGWEFKFIDKHEVARLWGARKNKPRMNYEKLSRGLRYYYDKNIIHKTPDKRFTYCFVCDMKTIIGKSFEQVHTEMGISPDIDDDSPPVPYMV